MELLIKKLALKAKIKSPDLLTRPVGRAIYSEAKNKISMLGEHEVLVLDFENIGVMDSSFIDEFIICLMKDAIASESPFYVKARNISSINQINIESVIYTYSKYQKNRIALVVNELTRDNTFVIGELSKKEHELISYVLLHKEATEKELIELLNSSNDEIKKIIETLNKIRILRLEKSRVLAV